MELSGNIWGIILIIIAISGIVKGVTGFGFALFSLPLLIHFIPVKNLVPLITLINLFTSIIIIFQSKIFYFKRSVLLLSISGSAGVITGSFILKYMPEENLKIIVSVALIIISFIFLTGYRFKIRKIRRGNVLAGFISGFMGGSLSVSGPPLALFLTSIKTSTLNFRYIFAWFSVITASVALLDYIKIGLFNTTIICIFLLSAPILLICSWLGKIIAEKISVSVFYKGVILITLLSGILLLYMSINNLSILNHIK